MIARVFNGLALCSSLLVAGNCLIQASSLESYDGPAVIGGAPCYYCHPQPEYCMQPAEACMQYDANSWYKRTFTGITQSLCANRELWKIPGDGHTTCMSTEDMDCVIVTFCTAANCPVASCGEPGVEGKPTMCDLGGDACMFGS
jgi:hypothetical protein